MNNKNNFLTIFFHDDSGMNVLFELLMQTIDRGYGVNSKETENKVSSKL